MPIISFVLAVFELYTIFFGNTRFILAQFYQILALCIKRQKSDIFGQAQEAKKSHGGLLDEMRRHAEAYDRIVFECPGVYRYTSPLFDRIETDARDWLGNEGGTLTEDFREFVNDPMFDSLRDSEAFQTAVG